MSEFSESYHLKSANTDRALKMLRHSGLKGYVLPYENDWVSMVAEGEFSQPHTSIIKENKGILLYYFNHENEDSWGFDIYENNKLSCRYRREHNGDVKTSIKDINIGLLKKIIMDNPRNDMALTDKEIREKIETILFSDKNDKKECAYEFAKLIGLPEFSYFSYYYVSGDNNEIYPNAYASG